MQSSLASRDDTSFVAFRISLVNGVEYEDNLIETILQKGIGAAA